MATQLLSPLKDFKFCQCIPPGLFYAVFLRGVSCSGALRVAYAFFHVNCTLELLAARARPPLNHPYVHVGGLIDPPIRI